jgi:hypothetical protein
MQFISRQVLNNKSLINLNMKRNTIEIIIEKSDGELWGRIEGKGNFLPTTVGHNTAKVLITLKKLIKDYQKHEGKNDPYWKKIDADTATYEIRYDLQAFFSEHDYLKQSKIAELANINPGLLRQYASGVKHPSAEQAKKIEEAIHKLANNLRAISLYAA